MVKRVLRLVYREVRGLHQAAYVLAVFAFSSQLLALVRDRMLAHQFGAGIELDTYYAAFRIPDLLYVIFASTLSVYVLIPFVTQRIDSRSSERAQALLSQVATLFCLFYSGLAIVIWIAAPYLVPALIPGLAAESDTVVAVLRVLLLQPLLLGLSSLFGVVTQIGHRFVLYALSPLVYNLGIIFGIVFLSPIFGVVGLGYGVVLGALLHLLIQLPLVRSTDLAFSFTRQFDWRELRSVLFVSVPRAATLALHQVVLLAFVAIASLMTVGSVAVFQFAYNLQSVPLAVIGASYSIAAFPMLADLYAQKKYDQFRLHVMTALRHIIFWSVPVIALIVVLRAQFVRVVLGSGEFNWDDTRLTAAVLAMLCVSLFAQAINLLIVRTFYAGSYTKVPFLITLVTTVVAIASTFVLYVAGVVDTVWYQTLLSLMRIENVAGGEVLLLALTYSLVTILQAGLLLWQATKFFSFPMSWLPVHFLRSVVASLIGGFFAYGVINIVALGINPESFVGIVIQGALGAVAGIGGIILGYFLVHSPELKEISHSFRFRMSKTEVLASQDDVL